MEDDVSTYVMRDLRPALFGAAGRIAVVEEREDGTSAPVRFIHYGVTITRDDAVRLATAHRNELNAGT